MFVAIVISENVLMSLTRKIVLRKSWTALAGIAQWIECRPVNQRVAGLIPSQGTCLGYRPDSSVGGV